MFGCFTSINILAMWLYLYNYKCVTSLSHAVPFQPTPLQPSPPFWSTEQVPQEQSLILSTDTENIITMITYIHHILYTSILKAQFRFSRFVAHQLLQFATLSLNIYLLSVQPQQGFEQMCHTSLCLYQHNQERH